MGVDTPSLFSCGCEASRTATAVAVAHGGGAVCNITSETIDCEREVKKHFGWGGRESFYCILATSENEVKCGRKKARALRSCCRRR